MSEGVQAVTAQAVQQPSLLDRIVNFFGDKPDTVIKCVRDSVQWIGQAQKHFNLGGTLLGKNKIGDMTAVGSRIGTATDAFYLRDAAKSGLETVKSFSAAVKSEGDSKERFQLFRKATTDSLGTVANTCGATQFLQGVQAINLPKSTMSKVYGVWGAADVVCTASNLYDSKNTIEGLKAAQVDATQEEKPINDQKINKEMWDVAKNVAIFVYGALGVGAFVLSTVFSSALLLAISTTILVTTVGGYFAEKRVQHMQQSRISFNAVQLSK